MTKAPCQPSPSGMTNDNTHREGPMNNRENTTNNGKTGRMTTNVREGMTHDDAGMAMTMWGQQHEDDAQQCRDGNVRATNDNTGTAM